MKKKTVHRIYGYVNTFPDDYYLACKTKFTHDVEYTTDDLAVTCKKCLKIMEKRK